MRSMVSQGPNVSMPRLILVFAGRTSFCWFCHEAAQMFLFYFWLKNNQNKTKKTTFVTKSNKFLQFLKMLFYAKDIQFFHTSKLQSSQT